MEEDGISGKSPSAAKIQLAVDMTCEKCSTDIKERLNANRDIKHVEVYLEKQTVLLETTLPTHEIVKFIEATGKKALVTGIGAAGNKVVNLGCAVAIVHERTPETGVRGVVRFVQSTIKTSVIDGTLDGLEPNRNHRVAIHEYGDLSKGCQSCGEILDLVKENASRTSPLYGDLGEITSDNAGRSNFRTESEHIKVWDIIGRSLVVSTKVENSSPAVDWKRVACGVIARSAGLFENFKKICACDGTTIWDEKSFSAPENKGLQQRQPTSYAESCL